MASQENDSFIAWVSKQPRDATYDYFSHCGCAFAQYLRATGREPKWVGGWTWKSKDGYHHDIPHELVEPLFKAGGSSRRISFGDLFDALVSA